MPQVVGLFPTPVMKVEALAPRGFADALLRDIVQAERTANAQSGQLSHTAMIKPGDDPAFARLADLLAPHLTEFGALLLGEKLRWIVKEMWANVMGAGGQQAMHNHANSFVSVVIYLTPTRDAARTLFYRPLGGADFAFANENANVEITPFNARKWSAPEMKSGDALFFPSYLLHEVPPNASGQRVTIALNALPERVDSWGYSVRFA